MNVTIMSTIGILIATVAVIYLAYQGFEPLICFPICAIFICLTSGISITEGIVNTYCTAFGTMVGRMLFTYLVGNYVGKSNDGIGIGGCSG